MISHDDNVMTCVPTARAKPTSTLRSTPVHRVMSYHLFTFGIDLCAQKHYHELQVMGR